MTSSLLSAFFDRTPAPWVPQRLNEGGAPLIPCPKRRLGGVMDKDLVDQLIDVAQRVVASGAISANGHGNVSLRVPGAEEMYFTAGPSLRNHAPSAVVRIGLDGVLLEGDLPPIQGAVVAMHTAMYADHADVGCVLHTHSPFATAYAVAHRPIGCWVEALACSFAERSPGGQLRSTGIRAGGGQHSRRNHSRSSGGVVGEPRGAGIPPNARVGDPDWRNRGRGRASGTQLQRSRRLRRDPKGTP